MLAQRLIWCSCLVSALAGCSSDSSSTAVAATSTARVFIDGLLTTSATTSIDRPPNRAALDDVELPCDGNLAVKLGYLDWAYRAPGLCGTTDDCGHSVVKLSHGDLTSSVSLVSSPALFTLAPVTDWIGTATLSVELVRDDGSPYPSATTPVTDQVDIPIVAGQCPVDGAGGAP